MGEGPTLFAPRIELTNKHFDGNVHDACRKFSLTKISGPIPVPIKIISDAGEHAESVDYSSNCDGSPSLSPRSDATDDIEILMSGTGQLYTQSDMDVHTPQTTVTSISSSQARSVPHIMTVQFADNLYSIPSEENSEKKHKPNKTKFSVFAALSDSKAGLQASDLSSTRQENCLSPNMAVNDCSDHNDALLSVASNRSMQGGSFSDVKESFSEQDHHRAVRDQHRKTRKRHFTDPVDFDGILRIIGKANILFSYLH